MSNIPNLPPSKPNRAARRHPNRAVRLPRPLAANLPPPEATQTSQTKLPNPATGTGADWAGADGSGSGDVAPDRSNDDEAYSVPDQPIGSQRQTRGRGRPRKESRETRIYQFLMQVYGFGGMMVYPINNYDGTVIVNQAESCAKGWIAVGQLHPEVMRVLDLLSRNNAYLLLVGSHVTMAIAIAGNHQWLPSNWAQRLGMPSPPPPPTTSPAATSASPGASSGLNTMPATSASFPTLPVTASSHSETPSPRFAAPGTDFTTGASGNSTPPPSMSGLSAEQVASIINQAQFELAQQSGQGSGAIPDPRQNPAYLEQLLERRE